MHRRLTAMAASVRAAIKGVPILVTALSPAVKAVDRVRARAQRQNLSRFRAYCSGVPAWASAPLFVKVGANDGIAGDPCSDILLADRRWTGILIEPVPYCFERLKAAFGDVNRFALEQVAIGATPGKQTFYYVDTHARSKIPSLPFWFDQLGSFDKNHIMKHLDGVLEPFIVEAPVAVRRLDAVLDGHGAGDVHLLHVDTEGYDYEVLKTIDLERRRPIAIFIEHRHLPGSQRDDMHRLLRAHGYKVRDCGGDYFAIRRH